MESIHWNNFIKEQYQTLRWIHVRSKIHVAFETFREQIPLIQMEIRTNSPGPHAGAEDLLEMGQVKICTHLT